MKRWPLLATFVLFIALCASATFWALQLFKPTVRPVAAAPQTAPPDVKIDAAAGLFGGRPATFAVASNFQLTGVVVASNASESVAIVSADGKPAKAAAVDSEVMPGVTVKEVNPQYVLLSEGGVVKRVELAESTKSQGRMDMAPIPTPPAPPSPSAPVPVPVPSPVTNPGQTPTPVPAPAPQTMVPATVNQVLQATTPYTGVPQRPARRSNRRATPEGSDE